MQYLFKEIVMDNLLTLKDVTILTNKSEGFIKSKVASRELSKYDKNSKLLADPIRTKGFFKKSDIENLFREKTDLFKLTKSHQTNNREYFNSSAHPRIIKKIHYNNIFEELKKVENEKFDVCIAIPPFNPSEITMPFSFKIDTKKNNKYLEECYEWIDKIYSMLSVNGSFLIHHIPRWLPYFCNYLSNRMIFKYWIAIDVFDMTAKKMFKPVSTGLLFMVKKNKYFRINKLRESHKKCKYCGDILKDYGGKKHLMHPDGAALSDVWKFIIKEKIKDSTMQYKIISALIERLINLSCTDSSKLLLAPFNGKLNIE